MRQHSTEQCIYCGISKEENDHVPPKCLLEKPYPPNLTTLPACAKCNRSFALDEEYFLILLAQIGTIESLAKKVDAGGSVDRALSYSKPLDDRIIDSLTVSEDGRVMIEPEMNRVSKVISKIAVGLFAHRYNKIISLRDISDIDVYPYNIDERRPPAIFCSIFTSDFRNKKWTTVQAGVFSYIFVKISDFTDRLYCIMDFHTTAWGFASVPLPRQCNPSDQIEFDLTKIA